MKLKKIKYFDSNKLTFDSNGKIMTFKPIKIELFVKDFAILKNNIKSMMVEFIFMISKFKKKIFTKNDNKYLKQLLKLSIELINSEENLENELMDEDYLSLYNIGLNIINILSGSISSKKTFPFLIEIKE